MTILDLLRLTDPQRDAATAPGDLVVTASAGAGKTSTLVGRYLALLESGVPLRGIVAITFTDKAAREMRTRIRRAISDWLASARGRGQALAPSQRALWEEAFAGLDGARIGTIHSLCAQVLREHPVEAARLGIMPGCGVLEEGRAAVLRARAVEEALAWAAADVAASGLFGIFAEFGLRQVLSTLLEKRLDADTAFARLTEDPRHGWAAAVRGWLAENLDHPDWRSPLDALAGLRGDDPTDKLELARQAVLAHAAAVAAARGRGDFDTALAALAALRSATALTGRKANWPGGTLESARDAMRDLRAYFDERLKPLADPDKPASWALDEQIAGLIGPLHAAYCQAVESYAAARRAENALDFDDLEAGAVALLEIPAVRTTWQAALRAVLVDEFQDTNERQRRIIYALTGFDAPRAAGASSLFVVGDGKQSIYRFRGADVTVFRRVEADVARAGGRVIPLDLTFRAHAALVETINRLLEPILSEVARPDRPYVVPFAGLIAYRPAPRVEIAPPFVEFQLGIGESADAGRQAAAAGLAARLLELRGREGVAWQDVALLFRASSAFAVYEDALERAGIPFVTVAGRGFYDRPEVRHLLNALVAVADPSDDLALVGFLRSPFVGLTDAALYRLRFPPNSVVPGDAHKPRALWPLLNHPALPDIVPADDLPRAVRGRELVAALHAMAGRVPVATLLKQLFDQTGYRGLLAVDGGSRAARNVDKLLADAHTSGLVSVRECLEYVAALRDVGARESEAPAEAGSAVQLMTVHKAKGLEFPVVVIADAAHSGHRGTSQVRLDEVMGVTVDPGNRGEDKRRPAAHGLATLRDAERDDAEDRRLLYVAATRAREKLLISAHTKILKGGRLSASGWLKLLGQVTGLDEVTLSEAPAGPQTVTLADDVGCTLYPVKTSPPCPPLLRGEGETYAPPSLVGRGVGGVGGRFTGQDAQLISHDLIAPLAAAGPTGVDPKLREREVEPPRRVWRVLPRTQDAGAPAWVVGTLVHAALRHWYFADDGLAAFMRPFALEMGVVDDAQLHAALVEARRMLRRFRGHPLWAELDRAQRWHEAPFSLVDGAQPAHGVIDLLCRTGDGWQIVEFKTDRLPAETALSAHIRAKGYDEQIGRYVRAVRAQLGVDAGAVFVFLNVGNQIASVTRWSSC